MMKDCGGVLYLMIHHLINGAAIIYAKLIKSAIANRNVLSAQSSVKSSSFLKGLIS